MEATRSAWAGRFIAATFVLGAVAWGLITVLVIGNVLAGLEPPNFALGPASSRIVAGGGAGTWFVMGLLSYLVVGIVGIAISSIFYRHIEEDLGAPLSGWRNVAAWIHLFLGAIGASAASLLMAYGGYRAGAALLPVASGGGGLDPRDPASFATIHAEILGPLVPPIAILMGFALFGYLVGGIATGTAWMKGKKAPA